MIDAVLFDLSVLDKKPPCEPLEGFCWYTPYAEYDFLSRDLVQNIVSAVHQYGFEERLSAVVWSKLYDLVTDFAHISRIALDLYHICSVGRKPKYNQNKSPITHFLYSDSTGSKDILQTRIWHYKPRRNQLAMMKRLWMRQCSRWQMRFKYTEDRLDLINHNTLVDEFLNERSINYIHCSPNDYDWSDGSRYIRPVATASELILEIFKQETLPRLANEARFCRPLIKLAKDFVHFHLNKAWSDLNIIGSRMHGKHLGKILASGTPKSIGRLIAWHYRRHGAQVYRFAHGGERVFYDDYPWSLAELPFCDHYYCHSQREANTIAKRYNEGRIAQGALSKVSYLSTGSIKHQKIGMRARNRRREKRSYYGRVMYVAGGYLGESFGDFPSRKPPDPLYLDWQLWLLSTLKDLGYVVDTKVHPKGILQDMYFLGGVSDIVSDACFDPERYSVDCYIYDFCGTAFFDTLASHQGIVLINMGIRPLDQSTLSDLNSRCQIVGCMKNENNLFRADPSILDAAVKKAIEEPGWSDHFFKEYFH